jgi:acetyl esterase/lipase
MRRVCLALLFGSVLLSVAAAPPAATEPAFTQKEDVVYGHKFGTALTMDVLTPKQGGNGLGIVLIVSGGWSSHRDLYNSFYAQFAHHFVKRGYTVFAVFHACQPKFTIPEVVGDINRAVRFVRYHAKDFGIDPDRIGVAGGSAGGHLSLMQGTAGDKGDPKAKDPVDRISSRVQAVACLFPPTDFLNYGGKDKYAFAADGLLVSLRAAADFHEFDNKSKRWERITDEKKVLELARKISPLMQITADTPPTLIIHGDADKIVPIEQAEVFVARLKQLGVPAELVVKKGANHGWPGIDKDGASLADWFDKYLKKQ